MKNSIRSWTLWKGGFQLSYTGSAFGKHQDVYKTFKFDVNSAFEQLIYTKELISISLP